MHKHIQAHNIGFLTEKWDVGNKKSITERRGETDWVSVNRTIDEVDGESFGIPTMSYQLEISGMMEILDDSDYDRESGYGEYRNATGNFDVEEFVIHEYPNDSDDVTDATDRIQQNNPKLYKALLDYAIQRATEQE